MINLDFLHPYPRYGVAAALVSLKEEEKIYLSDLTSPNVTAKFIAEFAADAIERALESYTLYTDDKPLDEATTVLKFDYLISRKLDPGQKSGQTAGNGYYLAPHVITNDKSSANTVAEARAIRGLLLKATEEDLLKPQQKLKRSFAPLTSKINNGNGSMSEPKASLLEAAFTVITTLTKHKAAAQVIGSKSIGNTTIIPDLPLAELVEFVRLFANLALTIDADFRKEFPALHSVIDVKNRKYRRPPIFKGNYPNAPRDGSLGVVALVAAIGAWAKDNKPYEGSDRKTKAEKVLQLLAKHPLYIISYDEFRQESFGSHLVKIAIEEDLPTLIQAAHRARPFGVEKIDDPKYKLYKFFFNRFLQQFSRATFRDFLATRTEYPSNLSPLIEQYMTKEHKQAVTPELVKSARAYGRELNRVAYRVAKKEEAEIKKGSRKLVQLQELKSRVLTQFESTILSAKTPTALLSQMNIIVGRIIDHEIHSDAGLFMETVASWPPTKDNLSLVQELVTAFMRLSSYIPNEAGENTEPKTEEEVEDDLENQQPDVKIEY